MTIPTQVSFRHLAYSPFVAATVRNKVARLERYFPSIMSVRVLLEPSELRRHQGNLYHVRIDIVIPGRKLVVRRDPSEHHAHGDIYVSIRDAFEAARRQLEDYVRIHFRGKKRHHEAPLHAKVTLLFPNEQCGFLETKDGREIYFHQNSVLNEEFGELELGDEVRIFEEMGDKGPQASTVDRIGKEGRHSKVA
ncbi:HPF/RaiA family ribosome-associated protein [Bdellovibrionota bacterium FG-2]